MNAIEIKNLCKTYPGFSLDHLNLTLPSGCIMGLVGENGAGKSTTMKLLLGMEKPDAGEITVLGRAMSPAVKEEIGVVLDEAGLPGAMNAQQIGNVMASAYRNWEPDTYDRYLKKLSVPLVKPFKDFSRGMKMKLSIAIALSHGAKLLILDEATSGLDPVVRDELLDVFNDFTRNPEHAVLISSHIVSDLEKICDYIAFLHKGKRMLCQEKDVLLEQYAFVHCPGELLDQVSPENIIGRKDGRFGTEAIIRREAVLEGMQQSRITIEELFVFMVKEVAE